MFPNLVRLKNRIYSIIDELIYSSLDLLTKDQTQLEITRLGSDYGGWWIPTKYCEPAKQKIVCISAGIGRDFSFDEKFIEFGHGIVGIDPIKEYCDKYFESLNHRGSILVVNKALSTTKSPITMSPPRNANSASWSLKKDKNRSDEDIVVPTISLLEALQETSEHFLDRKITILKMDIEGSEIEIMREILECRIFIEWLCVEFDFLALVSLRNPISKGKALIEALSIIIKLKKLGYRFVMREKSNLYFCYL